jgi:hypothetical protein
MISLRQFGAGRIAAIHAANIRAIPELASRRLSISILSRPRGWRAVTAPQWSPNTACR